MKFSVSKMELELVSPSEPTPSGHLPLSILDERFPMFYIEVILVFSVKGKDPAKIIREALAKALVPYYPIAGRLVVDPDNADRLHVALTGEGVPFVDASVDCTLRDVDYVQEQPLMIPTEQLLPGVTDPSNRIPFLIQVTEFVCGGFTVGIKFNHVMFDGVGAGQFMVAIGEIARGLGEPIIKPVWCRESFPGRRLTIPNLADLPSSAGAVADPSVPIVAGLQSSSDIKLERCMIDLSLDYINVLNDRIVEETGERCSTFEIAVAKLWQCRTRVIDLHPDDTVTLLFVVNARRLLNDIFPLEGTGYYGNCLHVVEVKAPSEKICNASLSDIVKLIKQEKANMPGKFSRILEGLEPAPHEGVLTYDKMFVVDWRRLGFSDTDYGWGIPNYVVPLPGQMFNMGWACLAPSPPPNKDIRIMMQSVAESHLEAFLNGMNDCS